MPESRRYLGLELAGGKNQKTAVAVLEFYPRAQKIFLLDVYEKITQESQQTGDQALLALLQELETQPLVMGVNVPLTLPPCITCTRKTCPLPHRCNVPAVKWMRECEAQAAAADLTLKKGSQPFPRSFTPYTQRPVELWMKHQVFPQLPKHTLFELDETLGSNRAPLAARMHFLQRHLPTLQLYEVSPKLTFACLSAGLQWPKSLLSDYRTLAAGLEAREAILQELIAYFDLFIYERDFHKLTHHLAALDALICALTALLADQKRCSLPTSHLPSTKPAEQRLANDPPQPFPEASGWVSYPDWKALR